MFCELYFVVRAIVRWHNPDSIAPFRRSLIQQHPLDDHVILSGSVDMRVFLFPSFPSLETEQLLQEHEPCPRLRIMPFSPL
jgi:hypothetical protein